MDFDIVKKQVIIACNNEGITGADSIREYIKFFKWYYTEYEELFQREHSHLRTDSIQKAISNIEEAKGLIDYDFECDDLKVMATKYFDCHFDNCDYGILHFSSPEIIKRRYYETLL